MRKLSPLSALIGEEVDPRCEILAAQCVISKEEVPECISKDMKMIVERYVKFFRSYGDAQSHDLASLILRSIVLPFMRTEYDN